MENDPRLAILKTMIRIRLVEQYIAARYPEQNMRCPTHLCIGQEAVPAVFGYFARPEDVFMGTYRSHGHFLAKGGELTFLFAELLGKSSGCSKGFGGSMHLIDTERNVLGTSAIVASGIPIAAGAAFRAKYDKVPAVVVAFFGDAALEEGVTYETVNFAMLHKLPLIFMCENNRLAIATPLEQRQAVTTLYNRFESLGIRGYQVEENKLGELTRTVQGAFTQVREGQGPVFLEYVVSRFAAHVGHEYVGPVDAWWQDPSGAEAKQCPIGVLTAELIRERAITLEMIQRLRQDTLEEIERAYRAAEALPPCADEDFTRFVYASPLTSRLPERTDSLTTHEFQSKEAAKLVNPF